MYPASDRFFARILESHQVVTEVVLFKTDGTTETLPHTGGSVSVDRGSQCRRTCSVSLPDPALIPRTAADKLAAYGAQVRISRGVSYADGTTEMVPLGVFRLDSGDGDVDEGPVTINGKSLECVIADDRLTAPYRAAGTAVGAITALIQRSLPTAAVVSRVADAAIGPRTFDIEADPWAAVTEIAATIGAEVYADADGTFVIAEIPDLATATPVWTISAGEGGAYIQASRGMTADDVRNGWLVRGENTETGAAPVSVLVTDSDPTSPTYWGGPFGRRPGFHSSPTIITVGAATAAGTLKLRAGLAPNASADISSLPNPALEPGDVIRVVYPDGTKELHLVHSFTVPLDTSGDFQIKTISAREGT
jgi:hypothetical protein